MPRDFAYSGSSGGTKKIAPKKKDDTGGGGSPKPPPVGSGGPSARPQPPPPPPPAPAPPPLPRPDPFIGPDGQMWVPGQQGAPKPPSDYVLPPVGSAGPSARPQPPQPPMAGTPPEPPNGTSEPGGAGARPPGGSASAPGSDEPGSPWPPPGYPPMAGTAPGQPPPTPDYSNYFVEFALDSDVQKEVTRLLQGGASTAQVLAYIRGTGWYGKHYPGISEGFAKGLVGNEADYRDLLNRTSQVYNQYLGRQVGGDEFANLLKEGVSLPTVEKRFQGQAYVNTYGQETQYESGAFGEGQLNPAEMTAYGRQQVGLTSDLGYKIQKRVNDALQRVQGVFQGKLASPAGLGLGQMGLSAPGLNPGLQNPDVGA